MDMDDGAAGSDDEEVASDNNEEVPKKCLVCVTKGPEPREKLRGKSACLEIFTGGQ